MEVKESVGHTNTHQCHRRTPSVLRRSPHPARLTGALKQKRPNLNLTQGKAVDVLRTVTSYFDTEWNTFAKRSSLTRVDYPHVSDGDRKFLTVHETNQTDHDL